MSEGRKDLAMNEAMAQQDRAGFKIESVHVTGGKTVKIGEGCSQEVGNMQSIDLNTPGNK
jgi:hypothetical protein